MANPSPPTTPSPLSGIPDSPSSTPDPTTAPQNLPMTASVTLTSLPAAPAAALAAAVSHPPLPAKVTLLFKPVGSAPRLRQPRLNVGSAQKFGAVVGFLRRRLGVEQAQGLWCYVNSVFAPGLDETVGEIWRCFKTGEELVVAYAMMPAFG